MADLPSRLDLFQIGRDYVIQRAQKIDPEQIDVLGSDVNIFVGSISQIAYAVILQLAQRVNALLLDGAQGEDLDRYAYDRYRLTRFGAVAAVVPVRFYRTSVAAGSGSIAIGTLLTALTGAQYVTTSVASFGATDTEATCDARAVQAGKDFQVGANAIRQIADISVIFDQTLRVNNDVPSSGGENQEEDPDFRERIRGFWNAARRGTLTAIEYGALQVPNVKSSSAVEALTPGNEPARVVNLYVADSSGVSSATLGNIVSQSLDDYRAAGIAVIVSTSTPQIVQVTLKLSFKATTDTTTLTDKVISAIVEYINSLPVNGPLYRSELQAVLSRFVQNGLILSEDTVFSPTGDIYPDIGKTIRTTTANVKVVLCQIAHKPETAMVSPDRHCLIFGKRP